MIHLTGPYEIVPGHGPQRHVRVYVSSRARPAERPAADSPICSSGSRGAERDEAQPAPRGANGFWPGARPDRVDPGLHLVEQEVVVRHHAGLEVAAALRLCPEPRAGEVGGAEVEERAVDGDHLEVNADTSSKLEDLVGVRAPLLGGSHPRREHPGRRSPVEDPHLDPLTCRLPQLLEEADIPAPGARARPHGRFDVNVLQVRGGDPYAHLGLANPPLDDLRVVVGVAQEAQRDLALRRAIRAHGRRTRAIKLDTRVARYNVKSALSDS